jgi:outer membrane protein assembly factor BamB
LGEALALAQKSPVLAGRAPEIARDLLRGRLTLARRCFDGGDIAAAKGHLERSITMLKSSGQGGQADDVVQAELQVARCDEVAGGRDAAMKRYETLLKDRPETLCWVSGGLSLSGETFLAMKRRGLLTATHPASASGPTVPALCAAMGGEIDIDDTVRALLAVAPSSIYVEGRRQRYRVDAGAGKLTASTPRAEPLAPGPASLVPAGDGRAVRVVANEVAMVRLDNGEVAWTRDAGDAGRFGRVMNVKATPEAVVVSSQKGFQVLSAADGRPLWEHKTASGGFDVFGGTAVLVTAEAGAQQWATLDLKTGRQIARQEVSTGTLWYWPVLAGRTVLMSDSLGGILTGFDAGTGRRLFELTLDTPLVGPPVVAGDKILLHTLKAGSIQAGVLDPAAMQVRAQAPLSAGGHSIAALFLPPLSWRGWVLYYDAGSDAVLAMNAADGRIGEVAPKIATSRASSMPAPAAVSWTVCADTLCLVGADGHVRLWRLEIAK